MVLNNIDDRDLKTQRSMIRLSTTKYANHQLLTLLLLQRYFCGESARVGVNAVEFLQICSWSHCYFYHYITKFKRL